MLWATCALYLWKQRQQGKKTTFLLCYITLLLIVETIYGIVQARTVQVMYIDNRDYPGGPWQYFLDTQYLAINVMFYATLFLITFLCDLLVVSVVCRHLRSSSSLQRSDTDSSSVALAMLGHMERFGREGGVVEALSVSSCSVRIRGRPSELPSRARACGVESERV